MTAERQLEFLRQGRYDDALQTLYGDSRSAHSRYADAVTAFEKTFASSDGLRFFRAPGRTEVGGNHTDHQRGCVLAGSVDLDTIAVVRETGGRLVRVQSEGYEMDSVDLEDLSPRETEHGTSAALIRGVCALACRVGIAVRGFEAYTTSNVRKGSGLSSSAAFEVLIGTIVNALFAQGRITPVEVAKIAQRAENDWFGKPCGLMDQMASSVGGFTAMDFEDPENPQIVRIPFELEKAGYRLCIVAAGGDHADLTDEYAAITDDCRKISKYFGKQVLRQVEEKTFYERLPELRGLCGDRAVLRAIHFFSENARAAAQRDALLQNDFETFLALVRASGDSSYKYLQNVYSCRNVARQGLSVALALSERLLGGRGACRVHGGGFAGTVQAFVPKALLADYRSQMERVFGPGACYVLSVRQAGGCEVLPQA